MWIILLMLSHLRQLITIMDIWRRLGTSVRAGLVNLGMDWAENMVLLRKLDFGAMAGIMGGLLGLPSEERVGRARVRQREKQYQDYGLA